MSLFYQKVLALECSSTLPISYLNIGKIHGGYRFTPPVLQKRNGKITIDQYIHPGRGTRNRRII